MSGPFGDHLMQFRMRNEFQNDLRTSYFLIISISLLIRLKILICYLKIVVGLWQFVEHVVSQSVNNGLSCLSTLGATLLWLYAQDCVQNTLGRIYLVPKPHKQSENIEKSV